VTPLYPSKLALASLTGGGRSVGLDPHGLLRQELLLLLLLCLKSLIAGKYEILISFIEAQMHII
jgi:hypothetical protein